MGPVIPFEPNLYLRWRMARLPGNALGEKTDQAPSEALLQQLWLYQRFIRERLQTPDGREVRVLHPGFWNQEAGPDFRRAIIQLGGEKPVIGDIEIDLLPGGWEQHRHHENPAYRKIVLHVTWEPGAPRHEIPAISLKHALDAPLEQLAFWLGAETKPPPESLLGQCSGPFRAMDQTAVKAVLRQAAQARLQRKAEQLQARARQHGWEAALWEGLFTALGYKRNVWPMRQLSELSGRLRGQAASPLLLQSRLFGLAGLLPAQAPRNSPAEPYLRQLWETWWREAEEFRDSVLPPEIWQFGGIRPANHPQRRLALASHWLVQGGLPARIEGWMDRQIESPDLLNSLEKLLQTPEDPFWSFHWTLKSKPFAQPHPLLGRQRVTDLAINVVLPWLYVRALAGRNESLARKVEGRYFLWPAGEDNAILKLARQRLFGGAKANYLKTAAEQQGVLQIVRDFCDYSNAACENCAFPDLLRAAAAARK